jgi:hypothetical protein
MLPDLPINSLERRCRNCCELLAFGSLLLAGAVGCTGARSQTTTASPQQETRISSRISAPHREEDNSDAVEEYPDFRGRRTAGPGLRSPGLPPIAVPSPPAEGLVEPPRFPGVDERDNGGPAASRRPRVSRNQDVAAAPPRPAAPALALPITERIPTGPTNVVGAPTVTGIQPASGREPVHMFDPPRLSAPPASVSSPDSATELSSASAAGFEIAKVLICRQVRGFDDVVEYDAQSLRQGQPILVYAALDGFLSVATGEGFRTQTLSSLEIQSLGGEMLLRIPLGTAVDISRTPRQNYFLTHRLTIPGNLSPGPYVFELRVDDVQSHQSARGQVYVTVTADRSRQDEMGGTSKFAMRHDSFLR